MFKPIDLQPQEKYLENTSKDNFDMWRKRNSYYYDEILRFLKYSIPENEKVLSIGFDDGWILDKLSPSDGLQLTFSSGLVEYGIKHYPNLRFGLFDNSLNFEKFNYVILVNTLGEVSDIQYVLDNLKKYCHPDTKLIVITYNYLWQPLLKFGELIKLKRKQTTQNWLSPIDLYNLLSLTDYKIIRTGGKLLIPKNIPILTYLINKFLAKLPILNKLNFINYVIFRPNVIYENQPKSVSVIVPARNEMGNIEDIVKRIPKMGEKTEIIFVEGGSKDNTWEEIIRVSEKYKSSKDIKYIKQKGVGKGDAVRCGFDIATCDILMILDADMTVPPEDLPKFYDVINSGKAEYVHGSRLIYPMETEAMRFLNLLGNKFFSLVFSQILGSRIKDTLCGTKALTRENYIKLAKNRDYFGEFDPFGDFDLIFGAHKLGLSMIEIPIRYRERTYGSTNISRFSHGLLLLKMCVFAFFKIE